MNESARSFGFTLIELLIVIAIIAVLSSAILPSFTGYIDTQGLKQAQEQVKSDLRSVQNRALTGTGADRLIGANPVKFWGLRFENEGRKYEYFIADANTAGDCTDPIEGSYELPEAYKFLHGGCIFFSLENGDANNISIGTSNRVIVGQEDSSSGDSSCTSVSVMGSGLVVNSTSTACQ